MAGILHPLQLSALNIIVHWCIMQAGAVQVYPGSYEIHSAAEYNDTACSPASNVDRPTPNALVSCFIRSSTGDTPKLYDTELGPQNGLPSPTTAVAYTLGGPSKTGLFERWIVFVFVSRVSLSRVTLHYYCTGTPPQLQLVDASGMATSTMTLSCGYTAYRHSLTVNMSSSIRSVTFIVKRNGGYFYLTEVQFFNEQTPDPATTFQQPQQTPSASSPTPISVSAQRSTTLRMTVTTAVTPATTNTVFLQPAQTHSASSPTCIRPAPQTCSASISAAIAGWVIAALAILVNGVQVIAMTAYCYKMRQRNMKQALDIPLRQKNLQCDNNQAYGTTQAKPATHYKNTSQHCQDKDCNAPESHYENTSQQHQANNANAPEPEYMVIPQHQ